MSTRAYTVTLHDIVYMDKEITVNASSHQEALIKADLLMTGEREIEKGEEITDWMTTSIKAHKKPTVRILRIKR